MPAKDFLDVARQIKTQFNPNKVMIVISGGEPLVRKDLEKQNDERHYEIKCRGLPRLCVGQSKRCDY